MQITLNAEIICFRKFMACFRSSFFFSAIYYARLPPLQYYKTSAIED